jgi:hypothetical protein
MDGWKREVPVEIAADYAMRLYFIKTDGSPIIVNGYVVGAGADESQFDYTTLDWDAAREMISALRAPGHAAPVQSLSQPPELPPTERPPVIDPDFEPAPILTDPGLTPDVLP